MSRSKRPNKNRVPRRRLDAREWTNAARRADDRIVSGVRDAEDAPDLIREQNAECFDSRV